MTVQSPQPPKKGMGPVAWIAIGCVVIIVLVGLAMVGVGGFVWHKVSKTVSVKDGKVKITGDKGQTATFDTNGANGGSVKVTDEKGQTATFSAAGGAPQNLPSWLPVYPGGTAQGTYAATTTEGHSGGFTLSTKDSIEQVANYYESQFKAAGLKVEKNLTSSNDKTSGGVVSGESADKKRVAGALLSTSDNGTQAVITFAEKQ